MMSITPTSCVQSGRVSIAAPRLSSVQTISGRNNIVNAPGNRLNNSISQSMTVERRGVSTVVAARRDGDRYENNDGFQDRVIQVRRVTKVVKGGKQLRFRAVVRLH